jgi:uncharacterized membrane protein YphA (DoxX/SURF4 family)
MSTVENVGVPAEVAEKRLRLKAAASATAALVLSLVFLASGIWKVTDLNGTAERVIQLLVPVPLSLPAAFAAAVAETFAGVLLLIPRFRRWGAWLAALMLIVFMAYFAVFYDRLLGEDCSCFPWVERLVGPAFFIGDAIMLALAVVAAWWSPKARRLRQAALVFSCLCLTAVASYGVSAIQRSGSTVPETAIVDGRPRTLRDGRLLLYFFDPECMHCYAVARRMANQNWGATRVVVLPTRERRFARAFLDDTGLQAGISPDADALRKSFAFTDPPYAIALDHGKAVATFNSGQMELDGFYQSLKRHGHITGAIQKGAPR